MIKFLFVVTALKKSGMILFSLKSPPPITFPALAVDILFLSAVFLKIAIHNNMGFIHYYNSANNYTQAKKDMIKYLAKIKQKYPNKLHYPDYLSFSVD